VRADLSRPTVDPQKAVRDRAEAFVREARLLGADDDAIRTAVARAMSVPTSVG
jgi:hypothetical protein